MYIAIASLIAATLALALVAARAPGQLQWVVLAALAAATSASARVAAIRLAIAMYIR